MLIDRVVKISMDSVNISKDHELVAVAPAKRKRTRESARLQEMRKKQGQVDSLLTDSQPDQTEPLGDKVASPSGYNDI